MRISDFFDFISGIKAKHIFFVFVCAIIIVAECDGDNSKEDKKEEVAEKHSEVSKVDTSSKSNEEKNTFIGNYSFTDKFGCKVLLCIKNGGTATVSCVDRNSQTFDYYCSWSDNRELGLGITIHFSDNKPSLNYDGGMDKSLEPLCLVDGYIYAGYDNTKSKNPRWRLKAVKTKAVKIQEKTYSGKDEEAKESVNYDWLQGHWVYERGSYQAHIIIRGDKIIQYSSMNPEQSESTFRIEDEVIRAKLIDGMDLVIPIDLVNQRIDYGNGNWMQKVSE